MHSPYSETRQNLRQKNKQVLILTSTLSQGFPASTSLSCIKTLTVCQVLSSGVSCNFMICLCANLVVKEKQNLMLGQ
jgi:formate/nitrite transporter FocA (FNT family)